MCRYKAHFLGKDYKDIRETNVPEIRLNYRKEVLEGELSALKTYANDRRSTVTSPK
jgi:hypothetical protein